LLTSRSIRLPPTPLLFPYTTLFRSAIGRVPGEPPAISLLDLQDRVCRPTGSPAAALEDVSLPTGVLPQLQVGGGPLINQQTAARSEEHTSESSHLVFSYAVFCLKKK